MRGIAGVVTGSDEVYFGFGLATSAGFALLVLASAFTGTPAAAHIMPLAVRYRPATVIHPLYRRVARQVTVAWAVCDLAVSAWEATHLGNVSAAEFIGLRALVGWPIMAVAVFVLVFYVRFRLDPLEHGWSAAGSGIVDAPSDLSPDDASDQRLGARR